MAVQLAGAVCVSSISLQLKLEEPHVLMSLLLEVDLSLPSAQLLTCCETNQIFMPVAYISLNSAVTAIHHSLCDMVQGETLFRTVIEVTGGGGAAGASGGSSEAAVRTALEDYMARLPQPLEMVEVKPWSRVPK